MSGLKFVILMDFIMFKYLVYSLFITLTLFSVSLADKGNKTLIIFSAEWCKYCLIAKNDINTDKVLSETIKKYEVIIVDFDNDKDMVEGYGIKNIPTFIIVENKEELKRQIGYNGPIQLNTFLK